MSEEGNADSEVMRCGGSLNCLDVGATRKWQLKGSGFRSWLKHNKDLNAKDIGFVFDENRRCGWC